LPWSGKSCLSLVVKQRREGNISSCFRYPVKLLLEENGISSENQDLSSFTKIGEPKAIANLINARREKDKPGQSPTVVQSASFSDDGLDLIFEMSTKIDVQKPELLMEQYGVMELSRITYAKVSLRSGDGNLLAAFASGLDMDLEKGPDGSALRQVTSSFLPYDQSMKTSN